MVDILKEIEHYILIVEARVASWRTLLRKEDTKFTDSDIFPILDSALEDIEYLRGELC